METYRTLWILHVEYKYYVCCRSDNGCLFVQEVFDTVDAARERIDEWADAALAA